MIRNAMSILCGPGENSTSHIVVLPIKMISGVRVFRQLIDDKIV